MLTQQVRLALRRDVMRLLVTPASRGLARAQEKREDDADLNLEKLTVEGERRGGVKKNKFRDAKFSSLEDRILSNTGPRSFAKNKDSGSKGTAKPKTRSFEKPNTGPKAIESPPADPDAPILPKKLNEMDTRTAKEIGMHIRKLGLSGRHKEAIEEFEKVKSIKGLYKKQMTTFLFTQVIVACAHQKSLDSEATWALAHKYYQNMKKYHLVPDHHCISALLDCTCIDKQRSLTMRYLEELRHFRIRSQKKEQERLEGWRKHDQDTDESDGNEWFDVIQTQIDESLAKVEEKLVEEEKADGKRDVVEEAEVEKPVVIEVEKTEEEELEELYFRAVAQRLLVRRRVEYIAREMEKFNIYPDIQCYNSCLKALGRINDPTAVLKLALEVQLPSQEVRLILRDLLLRLDPLSSVRSPFPPPPEPTDEDIERDLNKTEMELALDREEKRQIDATRKTVWRITRDIAVTAKPFLHPDAPRADIQTISTLTETIGRFDLNQAILLWDAMCKIQDKMPLDPQYYNTLLNVCLWHNDASSALRVWQTLIDNDIPLDKRTLSMACKMVTILHNPSLCSGILSKIKVPFLLVPFLFFAFVPDSLFFFFFHQETSTDIDLVLIKSLLSAGTRKYWTLTVEDESMAKNVDEFVAKILSIIKRHDAKPWVKFEDKWLRDRDVQSILLHFYLLKGNLEEAVRCIKTIKKQPVCFHLSSFLNNNNTA